MKLGRLVEFEEAFDEPKQDWRNYLAGIGNDALLLAATHFLGRQETGPRSYYSDMEQMFGPHNEIAARNVFRRLERIEQEEKSVLKIVHPKSALRLFEYAIQRPEEPHTQTDAELELNLFKAFIAQNNEYSDEQSAALKAHIEEPGLSTLAKLSLASTHSDFELVNFDTSRVLLIQLMKSVRLFQFLEADVTYHPLLAAFLHQYDCPKWQDYMRRLAGVVKTIIYYNKKGRIEIQIPHDEDYAASCAFLDKLTITPGSKLDEHDFLSTRAKPIYKQSEGIYAVVFPVFVAEMLHKGMFFQLNELVKKTKPKLLKGVDWRGAYCQAFSEDYLLGGLLDTIFRKRGLAWSGKRIKAEQWLKGQGDAEPDYYFRTGKRVILFESKDVNIKKEAKAGQDFAGFLAETRSKFYHYLDKSGNMQEVGVLQLMRNIKRLLSPDKELRFDTAYNPTSLLIYPVLVVHDRLYNMPGLNELVNGWFQQELIQLGEQAVKQVHPLVIIDIDTLLAYQDHFASKKLVLWEVIEAHNRSVHPQKRIVRSEQEARRLMLRTVDPFVQFLDDYARKQGLAPTPTKQFAQLIEAMQDITEPTE
ncbi:hypothetical protein BEN47_12260 [Hymenobacter lapidarius]|uniref:Uncharacterized protein n=1 Tax=Hymenobacter lapidarius TaxID=1908237 RepID=A0A1G1T7F9_9BACT|nr:hypothetical protein [Hymenobacter lapidarius]OGX86754.1 hypothetical protein BEN47_12260 [Hymenobacter lapidarius]